MRKRTFGLSVVVLAAGVAMPVWAQYGGRTITRETLTDPGDFIRAGRHFINKAHVAYVSTGEGQTTVYFVHGVPPLFLKGEEAKALVSQLGPHSDPGLPPMPNRGRSPFDPDAPAPARPDPNRRPTAPEVNPRPVRPSPSSPPLDDEPAAPQGPRLTPLEPNAPVSLPEPGEIAPPESRPWKRPQEGQPATPPRTRVPAPSTTSPDAAIPAIPPSEEPGSPRSATSPD